MDKICAFSTADDSYIPFAAASLLSIRHWRKDIPLYIISSRISRKSKKLLRSLDIDYIEIDLSNIFTQVWEYPVECYYLFAGPDLLLEKGFTHSLYIDGDVYCNQDPFTPMSQVTSIAGVANGTIQQILGVDYEKVTKLWPSPSTPKTQRLQSGVLYFNNTALNKFKFLDKIGQLYQKALYENIPRKGDDSLFALFQHVYSDIEYQELPASYNFITQDTAEDHVKWLTRDNTLIKDAVFHHFTQFPKPWDTAASQYPSYTYKYFTRQWRLRLIDSFPPKLLKKYFPQLFALLQDSHLKFYWYPSENIGDLITPYFLEKVCHASLKDYAISEEAITAIEAQAIPSDKAAYGVSTGSVIRLCGDKALVFGSGIRSVNQEVHPSFVRSVRGPLTRGRFIKEGYECPPIYGDPGLLLPLFYTPHTLPKRYELGIIPHFTEYEQVTKLYADDQDVLVINLGHGDLERAIDEIASCTATVSSSLHGLVLSHAYKIPTRRIIFSDKIFGDGTKFNDYYQGVALKPLTPIDATGFKYLPISRLLTQNELLQDFNTQQLLDAMFFDHGGLRTSARYPY